MLDSILATVQTVFGAADATSQLIMLVIALAGGMAMSTVRSVLNVTMGALAAYGLARLGIMAAQGTKMTDIPGAAWSALSAMTVNNLVVYFMAFAIVILVVYMVRSLVSRG